jgi:hypothetical protein
MQYFDRAGLVSARHVMATGVLVGLRHSSWMGHSSTEVGVAPGCPVEQHNGRGNLLDLAAKNAAL